MLIGLTVHAGPAAWVEPTVPYNCLRTHDWAGKHAWYDIEVSPGVYDWSGLDWLAEKCRTEGRQFVFVAYGTPSFYATDSADDPYGRAGGASMPNTAGIAAWRAFVRAAMRRYPASIMPVVEPWNEPVSPFFNGTRAQIAQLARIVYEEKRGHLVPTPSFYNITHLTDYLAQPDALYCDAINLHLYGNNLTQLQAAQASYRTVCNAAGLPSDLPFFHSEIGWIPYQQTGAGWTFDDLTDTQIGDEWEAIVRWLESTNCIGAIWYDYDGTEYNADVPPKWVIYAMREHPDFITGHARLVDLTGLPPPDFQSLWSQPSNTVQRLRDLPDLEDDKSNLNAWAKAVNEHLQTFRGVRGDPLDRALTERRAIALGLLNGLGYPAGGSGGIVIVPGGGTGPGGGTYTPDYTPPPTPTGLLVSAGITSLIVECDPQTYTVGHGHDRTNVYGAKWAFDDPTPPTFTEAVRLWQFLGTVDAYTTDPNTRWCIWIKWQSKDGIESTAPAGGTNGFQVTTGLDVTLLLQALTGKITASQLFADLGKPLLTLRQRFDELAADTLASVLAVQAETKARADALLQEARDRGTAISDLRRVVSTGNEQLAQQITTLTAAVTVGDQAAAAALQEERTVRAAADAAEAAARTTLAAQVGTNTAAISEEATARVNGDTALAATISTLSATVSGNTAAITTEATTRANADTAIVASVTALTATVNSNTAAITSEATTRASADTALSNSLTTLSATVGTNTAAIASEATTRANADTALTSSITSLSSTVGSNTAAIATNASTIAALDGSVAALYTVRAEVSAGGRTVVGGFGLSATSTASAGPRIDFGVRADQFWIAAPSSATGISDIIPFVVQTTSTTVNGVSVPPGVYMDAAYIKNGTITAAKIGNAVIDDAKIASLSVAKLIAGSLSVGAYVRSTVYTPGSAGWTINADGTAEFSGVVVRGTIYAGAGSVGGFVIDSNAIRSSGYSAGVSGLRLGADGTAELMSGAIGGLQIYADRIQSSNFVAGSAGFRIKNDGTAEFSDITLRTISASIASGNLSVSVLNGRRTYGTRTVTASGGFPPYTYQWLIAWQRLDNNLTTGYGYIDSGATSATVTLAGTTNDNIVTMGVICIVHDANGRSVRAGFTVDATHGSPP